VFPQSKVVIFAFYLNNMLKSNNMVKRDIFFVTILRENNTLKLKNFAKEPGLAVCRFVSPNSGIDRPVMDGRVRSDSLRLCKNSIRNDYHQPTSSDVGTRGICEQQNANFAIFFVELRFFLCSIM
jgi:hypothetical protein